MGHTSGMIYGYMAEGMDDGKYGRRLAATQQEKFGI